MKKNAQYRAAVARFAQQIRERPEQVARAVVLGMSREVVLGSPVDTGRFRGNWQLQQAPTPNELNTTDKSGGATLGKISAALRDVAATGKFYLMNHLPYAIPLEYGHSKQAPSGIVRLVVQRFNTFVADAARAVRS